MDYFKHYSTASEGNTLNHLMDEFGHQGYSGWFLLLELCNANWDGKSEPKFNFYSSVVRKKLRISGTKLKLFLEFCQTNTELSYRFSGKNLEIHAPMLADIKETRGRISGNKLKKIDIYRIDKEEDKDTDKEGINNPASLDLDQAKAGLRLSNYFGSHDETKLPDARFDRPNLNAKSGIVLPDFIIQKYNDRLARKAGKIEFCRGLSAKQIDDLQITLCYPEFTRPETWVELFDRVYVSPFLTGQQEGSTFVATLDWLIIHGNALKVLSGKYPAKTESTPGNQFSDMELN